MKINIAIAEDNPTTRKQHLQRFSFYDDINIVSIADNGQHLLDQLKQLDREDFPGIILMDIEMPVLSGIEATAMVKSRYPNTEVMMLTVFKDEEKIFKSIQAGASGYLLKDCSLEDLIEAIYELKEGGSPLSKSIARKVLEYMRQSNVESAVVDKRSSAGAEQFNLTEREIEILKAIVRDDTEYAIASDLKISQHTVRTHVKNIYKKLQVHSRGAVVKAAYEHNLFPKSEF